LRAPASCHSFSLGNSSCEFCPTSSPGAAPTISSRKRLQRWMTRLRMNAMPTAALSRISSCSASARCTRSSAARCCVMSVNSQT
jgi:hypothetical protein